MWHIYENGQEIHVPTGAIGHMFAVKMWTPLQPQQKLYLFYDNLAAYWTGRALSTHPVKYSVWDIMDGLRQLQELDMNRIIKYSLLCEIEI